MRSLALSMVFAPALMLLAPAAHADILAPDAPPTIQLAVVRSLAPFAADTDSTAPPAIQGAVLQSGVASWYGRAWQGRRMAGGGRFDLNAMTAASHSLPLGTRVLVTLEGTARSVMVTITDRQGAVSRVIDLSRGAARKIGMLGMGTARVILRKV